MAGLISFLRLHTLCPLNRGRFNEARYIHPCRDPQDVCASFREAIVGEKDPFFVAQRWVALQERCLEVERVVGRERYFRVRYEEVVVNPAGVLGELCAFLGVEYEAGMLSFYESDEARQAEAASALWDGLARPVNGNAVGRYRQELGEEEIAVVEAGSGDI